MGYSRVSLEDLIQSRKHSSAPLEKPSESPAVAGGESGPNVDMGSRVPGDDQREGFSSGEPLTDGVEGEEQSAAAVTSPPAEKPYGVQQVITPSGIEIYYQAGPKRLYRIRNAGITPKWIEPPSVSKVLDILEKGGLPWWGMKVGVQGVITLHNEHGRDLVVGDTVDGIVDLLKKYKLTVNDVRDSAGDRGQNVHDALELWAKNGVPPQPAVYALEEQGYVSALADFLVDSGAEPVRSEVMVASMKHKYAGRYDLDTQIPNGAEVVVKTFPKMKDIRMRIPGGLYLLDLKTSKDVYDTHFIQLEGYEAGRIECGYEPTLYRGVIHVTEDGRYELRLNLERYGRSDGEKKYQTRFEDGKPLATFTDFKHVLGTYKALQRVKGRS